MAASEALIKRLRFCWLTLTRDEIHQAADYIEKLEADNALLREALEDFVACVGVSDDPDILMVDACAYENATRVLGVRG